MKKLGFGLMRLPLQDPDKPASIDMEVFKQMVDHYLAQGFSYFDTAYPYHQGKSEEAFRIAVAERYPRERYTITDKMPCWSVHKEADFQTIFDTQLQRCGVDYFDYYWLHALNKNYYAKMKQFHGFEFISRMKAEGKIKHIGFSFHDRASLLEQILSEHPEVEYVQLQLNYLDWEDPSVQARLCYETCVRHGKPVIVMEPVKGGSLAKVPAEVGEMFRRHLPDMSEASWAVRYAASLPNVMVCLSGMSNMQQLEDNVSYMKDFAPLTQEEQQLTDIAAGIIRHTIDIPCTACHYCTDGCPKHICIPEYFALYNNSRQFPERQKQQMNNSAMYYMVYSQTHGKASACIECGQCKKHCPQHIDIPKQLKKVAQVFG